MAEPFSQEMIAASLFSYWADELPIVTTTVYPATPVNTAAIDEWFEIVVEGLTQEPQRGGAKQLVELGVTVHCYVKQSLDKSRVHELVDAAKGTLSHAFITVRDFDESGQPILGYLSLRESETNDLTRNHADTQRHSLQHIVVRWRGIVQQV